MQPEQRATATSPSTGSTATPRSPPATAAVNIGRDRRAGDGQELQRRQLDRRGHRRPAPQRGQRRHHRRPRAAGVTAQDRQRQRPDRRGRPRRGRRSRPRPAALEVGIRAGTAAWLDLNTRSGTRAQRAGRDRRARRHRRDGRGARPHLRRRHHHPPRLTTRDHAEEKPMSTHPTRDRGHRPAQVLRRQGRPRRHRPARPGGNGLRPARPQRRRQDHDRAASCPR